MRILLVVNDSASSVTARARVIIQQSLGAAHDLTVAATSRRGHATRLAQGAAADGIDVVAVLGGDGTLNEAANGLAGTNTALGVLPGGSTNVFARTIGMANDPIGATRQLLDSLAPSASDGSVRIRAVSLGSVNGRYFLFHVGLGFDASVVAEVEKRSSLKRYFGAIVFLGAAVATWAHYDRRTPWFRVRAGGEAVDGYFAIAMKTSPYTFLGRLPFDVAPGTGFDTGLSLVVCRVLTLPTLLALVAASVGRRDAPRVSTGAASLRPGWRPVPLAHSPRVTLLRDLDQVELTAYRPVAYQVDGDYLGEAETLTLRCVPDALRLVVPAAH